MFETEDKEIKLNVTVVQDTVWLQKARKVLWRRKDSSESMIKVQYLHLWLDIKVQILHTVCDGGAI